MLRKGKSAVEGDPKKCWNGELIAPISSLLNVVARSPTTFGLGRNGCWPSEGPSYPGHSSRYIVVICCFDNRLLPRVVICGYTVSI